MPTIKKICCLLIACFITCTVHAQNNFRTEWAIGASGGLTYAKTSFSPKIQQSMYRGYTGGLIFRWITEKNLGLQIEANYKQQGWQENFDEMDDGMDYTGYYYRRRMNYLDIPFLTHVYFGDDRMRFFINAGPQVGFLLNEKTQSNLNGIEPQRINVQHTMPAEKSFEWGIGGGPGVELRAGNNSFIIEGRFYYALSDFYSTRRKDVFGKASGQVIMIKLAYLVALR